MQKAISNDPRFVNFSNGLGTAYAEKGDLVKAEAQYLKALQMMPDSIEVCNALGLIYLNQGKVKEDGDAFDKNLQLDPENINALVNRASIMAYKNFLISPLLTLKMEILTRLSRHWKKLYVTIYRTSRRQ